MKFNLLDYGYITVSGTPSLNLEDIQNMLSRNGTVTLSGSENHNLSIYGDIVDRIGIDQIRYYFDSNTSSGTVASGIHFYYKNDAPVPPSGIPADPYLPLTTNVGPGYYYTTVPSPSAPRYIKLNHTVSGTSISGTIVGFEVLNDDSVVDFGADGNLTSSTTLTSLSYLNYNDYIKEIEIYNSGSSTATAHVFIDPQYNDADILLSISNSESGPWVFARNTDYIISNGNNWNAGKYNHTSTTGIADGRLRLSSGYTTGTYTTPIFKNDSVKFAYIDMLDTSVSGAIVAVDSDDYTSTIEIRNSSSKPWDYNVYRVLYYGQVGNSNRFYYKDFLVSTDTEIYDSYNYTGEYFGYSWTYYGYTYIFDYTQFVIEEDTQKTVVVMSHVRQYAQYGTRYRIEMFVLSQEGVELKNKVLAYASINSHGANPYDSSGDIKMDSEGGIWFYNNITFTPNSYNPSESLSSSYEIDSDGYWLLHLDSDLNVTYNYGTQPSNFIAGSWSPVVGDTSLWYCSKIGIQAVVKLTSSGTINFSYEEVTDLAGLCSTSDGGCWFIDENNLYKLNSSGILINSITNLEINSGITFVEIDPEDTNFLWIVDGVYVKRIYLDGIVYSSTYLEGFSIRRLLPTNEGLWVYCTEVATGDQYAKYIGKLSSGVEKTIECVNNLGGGDPSDIGVKYVSYDNPILGNLIPLSDDPIWNNDLPWNKAVTDNAVLPREQYNQLRLTLRRPSANIDSPTVENIYYQDNVELTNIYPGQSKTLYLKISLPNGVTIGGDYASNLRVWWELPVV